MTYSGQIRPRQIDDGVYVRESGAPVDISPFHDLTMT